MLYWEEQQIRRKTGDNDFTLLVDVSYSKRTPYEWQCAGTFDSHKTIKKSLKSLRAFKGLIDARSIYDKQFETRGDWTERIIFGKYYIDSFNQVWRITETAKKVPARLKKLVLKKADFIMEVGSFTSTPGAYIPDSRERCTCCGKRFTIKDIRVDFCIVKEGKVYHESCYNNYEKQVIISTFTSMMDYCYPNAPFELLPNGYCKRECCAHKPWFLFHTPDGDIEIGWRKRVISITWMENYKPFDMAIFNSDKVTRLIADKLIGEQGVKSGNTPSGVTRLIHAWTLDKAYEYIKRAKNSANGVKEK